MMSDDKIVDLGTSDTFLPEVPREEAEAIAQTLIAQGCVFCGATEQSLEVIAGTGQQVTAWYPVRNSETGEQRFCCAACYLHIKRSQSGW